MTSYFHFNERSIEIDSFVTVKGNPLQRQQSYVIGSSEQIGLQKETQPYFRLLARY